MSQPHAWYPLFLDMRGRSVLVVGGGSVAARKVSRLLACGAAVTLVAPRVDSAIEAARPDQLLIERREFRESDLDERFLVVAATSDPAVNEYVARAAGERRMLVNVVDDLDACTAVVPSVAQRGSIQIAVSTGGASPLVARLVRERVDEAVGEEFELLAEILRFFRAPARELLGSDVQRRALYEAVASRDTLLLLSSDESKPQALKTHLEAVAASHGMLLPDDLLYWLESRA